MTRVVHMAKRIKWRVIAACGLWAIDETTTDRSKVTCLRCAKTKTFWATPQAGEGSDG
jgi:hypothetical protein